MHVAVDVAARVGQHAVEDRFVLVVACRVGVAGRHRRDELQALAVLLVALGARRKVAAVAVDGGSEKAAHAVPRSSGGRSPAPARPSRWAPSSTSRPSASGLRPACCRLAGQSPGPSAAAGPETSARAGAERAAAGLVDRQVGGSDPEPAGRQVKSDSARSSAFSASAPPTSAATAAASSSRCRGRRAGPAAGAAARGSGGGDEGAGEGEARPSS